MSLNDEAMDDLHEEADYLTQSEGEAASLGVVRVETEDAIDLKLPKNIDEAVSALSDYDVQIQTTKDKVTKVFELDDVASTVLAQETISQADAAEVERVYSGLYDAVAGPKEYTEAPSSINLKATQDYVAEKKIEALSNAFSDHKTYVEKTSKHVFCLLHCLNEEMLPMTLDEFDALRRKATDDLSKASVSNNFLVYTKECKNEAGEITKAPELIDLKNLRLYGSIEDRDYQIPESLNCLPDADDITKLREVYHGKAFRSLMMTSNIYRDVLEALHRDFHSDGSTERNFYDLTYLDLLTVFASGKIETFLTRTFEALNAVASQATPVIERVLSSDSMSKEELSETALAVSDFYEKLMSAEKFRSVAYMFCYRAKPILDGFRQAL